MFCSPYFWNTKSFVTQNFLWRKIFGIIDSFKHKFFGSQNFSGPKISFQNFIWHNIFFASNISLEFFHNLYFMTQNFPFTQNFSWSEIFHDLIIFMTQNFLEPTIFFVTQIFLEPRIFFVTQYFLELVIFELQQFGTHNFLCSKIFRDLNFLEPKLFRIQFIFVTLSNSNPTWNSTEP